VPASPQPAKRKVPAFGLNWDYRPTEVAAAYLLDPRSNESLLTGEDDVNHTLIQGDNLHALWALYDTLANQVDFCYIDPPYNTGNTEANGFTYKDSFRNKEDRDRHSTWLTFMHERLLLTHDLLSDRGVIAISIDDREIHYLRMLCDEIFGETNFIAQMIVDGGNPKNNARFISTTHEYLLVYVKDMNHLSKTKVRWRKKRDGIDLLLAEYSALKRKHGSDHAAITSDLKKWMRTTPLSKRLKVFFNSEPRGLYTYADLSAPGNGARYEVKHPDTGKPCAIPSRGWGLAEEKLQALIADDMVLFGKDETFQPMRKLFLKEENDQVERSIIAYPSRTPTHLLEKMLGRRNAFNNPKNLDLISEIIRLMCPEDGIVLDYFAGSGTTGHAVLMLNAEAPTSRRQFVLVTNNENNIYSDVCYPRLKAAITGRWLNGTRHRGLGGNLETFIVRSSEES
jgi:adenine-specific DNA-methyltransferase